MLQDSLANTKEAKETDKMDMRWVTWAAMGELQWANPWEEEVVRGYLTIETRWIPSQKDKLKEETKTYGFCISCLREQPLDGKGVQNIGSCLYHEIIITYSYFFLAIVFPKVITYIVVLILIAVDFWITKNIIGRKLVKLRWWYTIDDASGGTETWIYESKQSKKRLYKTHSY